MSSDNKEFPIPVPMRSGSDLDLDGEITTESDKNNTDNLDDDGGREQQVVKNHRNGSSHTITSSAHQGQENRTNRSKSPFNKPSFEFSPGDYLYSTDSSSDLEEIVMQVIDSKAEKGASLKSPKLSSTPFRNNSESDNGALISPLQLQPRQAKMLTDGDAHKDNNDMSSSDSSSSSSFSCATMPEDVSNKIVIGTDQSDINGEKTATVGNGSRTRPAGFPAIPQDILNSSIFNYSSDSSSFSVSYILPQGTAGHTIGFPPVPHFDFGSDDSMEGTHHRNNNSVFQKDVSEGPDPVFDQEFEPVSASESGMNPIEDSDSTSGPEMDQKVESPEPLSLAHGDSQWQGDNDATFADEEVDMDDNDTTEPDGISSDSELELKDRWPCHKCKTLTSAVTRYCLRCFQIRRNWLPQRPKKSKSSPARKRAKGQFQNDGKEREHHSSSSAKSSDDELNIRHSLKLKSLPSIPFMPRPSYAKQAEIGDILCSPQKLSVLNPTTEGINNSQLQLSHLPATSASPSSSKSLSTSESAYVDSTDGSLLNATLSISTSSSLEESSQPFSQLNDSRILNLSITPTPSSQSPSSVSIAKDCTNDSGIEPCSSSQSLHNILSDVMQPPLKLISQTETTTKLCENHEAGQNICRMCCVREKDAAFVHRKIAHSCCCYSCATKIVKSTGRCPICRGKVLSVVKIIND